MPRKLLASWSYHVAMARLIVEVAEHAFDAVALLVEHAVTGLTTVRFDDRR